MIDLELSCIMRRIRASTHKEWTADGLEADSSWHCVKWWEPFAVEIAESQAITAIHYNS